MQNQVENKGRTCSKDEASKLLAELKQQYEQLHPYKQCNVLWEMLQVVKEN